MAYEAFRQKGREVTAAVRQDDTKFFESLAQQTRHMDESSDSQGLWKQLRKVLPKNKARRKNQPLTLQGLQDDWIQHFSALEAGVLTTVDDLQQQCNTFQANGEIGFQVLPRWLPTLLEVENLMRSMAANKSPGIDGIPSEVFKLSARFTAPILCGVVNLCRAKVVI